MAVIPVIDEAATIGEVAAALRRRGACCVIVVDGASRDGTPAVARAAGALVRHEPRRGYGWACLTGTEEALQAVPDGHHHERIAFLDGDGSCDPDDVVAVVRALDGCDVAVGRRVRHRVERGALPIQARVGNAIVAGVLRMRTRRRVEDLAPTKAVRAATLRGLRLDATGYAWTVQLIARALMDRGVRVRQVPVGFRRRGGGVSKVSGSWSASIAAGREMLSVALHETRPRVVLVLMAKAPRARHAKTRLAVELGEERTLALWTASLTDTGANIERAAAAVGASLLVVTTSEDDVRQLAALLGPTWAIRPQRIPGLPGALAEAFLLAHARGADRAIAIAGDIPHVPPDEIVAAIRALDRTGRAAVVGPSLDGGYHYVGLRWRRAAFWWPRAVRRWSDRRFRRRLTPVFQASTGGEDVLSLTIAALIDRGWRPMIREPELDLDTIEDLRVLERLLESDGRWAPLTRRWLDGHRADIHPLTQSSDPTRSGPSHDRHRVGTDAR